MALNVTTVTGCPAIAVSASEIVAVNSTSELNSDATTEDSWTFKTIIISELSYSNYLKEIELEKKYGKK